MSKPTTNYSERLDGVLQGELVCISNDPESYVAGIDDTKQAITSLIKELVAEAKPEYRKPSYGNGVDESLALSYSDKEYNLALDQFEQNLLKALEENNEA